MTAPVASGGSEFAGWDLHPLESAAFARRTSIAEVPVLSRRHVRGVGYWIYKRKQMISGQMPAGNPNRPVIGRHCGLGCKWPQVRRNP